MKSSVGRKLYPKAKWAVQRLIRETGLQEDICRHGIGHPNQGWMKQHDSTGEGYWGVHGCDGCCREE